VLIDYGMEKADNDRTIEFPSATSFDRESRHIQAVSRLSAASPNQRR
jgi:hypothetical protein